MVSFACQGLQHAVESGHRRYASDANAAFGGSLSPPSIEWLHSIHYVSTGYAGVVRI